MPLEPGTLLLNRYRVIDILGQGGMGSVYRATDENLGVCVAVKENLFLSDEYARQFRLEANILAGLRHSGLPRVGDHFVIDHQGQYLVMDYIEGDDLRQAMDRSGLLNEDEVVRIGVAICDALSYLHTRVPPVVHRDIKPGNIKLALDGNVVLVDFGLAKIMLGNESTTTGARAMTPGYSPPEQYGTARTDARSDIYSLGATLYVALTNVVPEDGLARVTGNAVLTNLRKLNQRVTRKLANAITKAMAVDPDSRYQSADDFKQTLLEIQYDTRGTSSKPVPYKMNNNGDESQDGGRLDASAFYQPPQGIRKFLTKQWRWVLGSFILLALLISVSLYWISSGRSGLFLPAAALQPTRTTSPSPISLKKSPTLKPFTTKTIEFAIVQTLIPTREAEPVEATPTASPTAGFVVIDFEQIVFVSERTGNPQLWIMKADGSDQQQLTTIKDGACQPDWSPDGKELVFISPCPSIVTGRFIEFPGSSMHLIHADGTGLQDLPLAPEGDFDPVWSPDGSQIAFTSLQNGHPQVYIMDLSTRARRDISNNNFADRQPAWSPDGKSLVFARLYGSYQLWLMSPDGSNQKQFTRGNDMTDLWPVWTLDSKIVFFNQTGQDGGLPWLMAIRVEDIATNKEFKVPALRQTDFGYIARPRVSPDNRRLVFEGWSGADSHDIWIMTLAGAERRRLTNNTDPDYSPVWRPKLR